MRTIRSVALENLEGPDSKVWRRLLDKGDSRIDNDIEDANRWDILKVPSMGTKALSVIWPALMLARHEEYRKCGSKFKSSFYKRKLKTLSTLMLSESVPDRIIADYMVALRSSKILWCGNKKEADETLACRRRRLLDLFRATNELNSDFLKLVSKLDPEIISNLNEGE